LIRPAGKVIGLRPTCGIRLLSVFVSHAPAGHVSIDGRVWDLRVENSVAKRVGRVPDYLRSRISLRVLPQDWLAKARVLKKAVDRLFIDFEIEREEFEEKFEKEPDTTKLSFPDDTVVTMLLGFAVENLLKGLHVSTLEHMEGVKDLSELPSVLRRHELRAIACAVTSGLQIEYSEEELDLLDALTHVIVWYGRYPSARNIDDLIPVHDMPVVSTFDGQLTHHFKKFRFNYPHDYFATLKLYDRLETLLQEKIGVITPYSSDS
jgi:hypothetical protein